MIESLTIIIPSYNDATGLSIVLPKLIPVCEKHGWKIIVVDDHSSDGTSDIINSFSDKITSILNSMNLGYGASIKRGILAAETEWIASFDADNQHRVEDLVNMARACKDGTDAQLGVRNRTSHAPLLRRPGKWVLKRVANFLAGQNIPDINCGLRILRREIILKLFSITSDRFSFSTSTTISLLQLGCSVNFFPVIVEERVGKSNVRQIRDGFYTMMIILRLIFLFQPLRVMLPVGLGLILSGLISMISSFFWVGLDITENHVLLLLTGLITFFIALLADQTSGLRRDMILHDIKMRQLMTCDIDKSHPAASDPK